MKSYLFVIQSNMMIKLTIIIVATLLMNQGCDTVDNNNEGININELTKEWFHSYEEQTDSLILFRPRGFKEFPRSRYRQEYIFSDNGNCKFLILEAADRHFFKNGFWNLEDKTKIITIVDSSQNVLQKFEIKTLTRDLLKVDFVNVRLNGFYDK